MFPFERLQDILDRGGVNAKGEDDRRTNKSGETEVPRNTKDGYTLRRIWETRPTGQTDLM